MTYTHCDILTDAPYRDVLALQRSRHAAMVERRRLGMPLDEEYLMLVEHRPVYTIGRHGEHANMLHPELISALGAELVEIERGGDITFHGPGQLVAYPLIDIAARNMGVKAYVHALEEAVIATIARWGIEGHRIEGATGVWVESPSDGLTRKICAIGISCRRFITMHGLALNVNTDLAWFSHINPCGFTDRGVTSIARERGAEVDFAEVSATLRDALAQQLSLKL